MTIAPGEFAAVQHLVLDRAAIVIEPGKEYLVDSRLTTLARDENFPSIKELLDAIRTHRGGPLEQKVIEALTTNETSFYRDVKPFDALRLQILPELIEARRVTRSLTIWSGAASTGQETYSIAILIREHFPKLSGWTVRILGTDLSSEVLVKARSGKYTQHEVERGLTEPLLLRYFERDGTQWRVNDVIRRMVEFKELNLAATWPALPKPDVVFLRNVLIYLDLNARRKILGRIADMIATDGYLFLGAGETPNNLDPSFDRVDIDKAGCFRLSASATSASSGGSRATHLR